MFNFTGCHESGIANEGKYRSVTEVLKPDDRQHPEQLTTLPPYHPDNRVTREDWKRYYELITAMDYWVRDRLLELKEDGEYENTIIMFYSDHGVGLPRAKRWLYDSGTRVPFIVRIPEDFRAGQQGKPGTTDDQLVSSVDFAPTALNLAGIPLPTYFHGRAFLGEKLNQPRKYIYGARDRMDERYDFIRAVRDNRYRYVRNYEPLKPYYQYMNTPEKGATMKEIRKLEEKGGPLPKAIERFSGPRKPVEELYDLWVDPHEVKNLASEPGQAKRLEKMRDELIQWQTKTADLGLLPESEISLREDDSRSTFDLLRDKPELVLQLLAFASKASEGAAAIPDLTVALTHPDAAVRYWGATGLGNFPDAARNSDEAADLLAFHLFDNSPAVRIASARALCRMGITDPALAKLAVELRGENQWARLEAAIVLDELDETARPVLPELQAALHNQPNKYIVRVANKAVNDLLGTTNEVR